MTQSSSPSFLAIDGGGTRCRIACQHGAEVIYVETGSANVFSDFDGALVQITTGLTALAAQMQVTEDALARMPAFIGVAGMRTPQIASRLRDALPFANARIEDDRPAALRGALGTRDGALIHCGTGSFLACQTGGHIRLAGGWGPMLGDEASARWLGWAALNAALKAQDGTVPQTALLSRLIRDLGGVDGALTFGATATPADYGRLAPHVTAAAQTGDPVAQGILRDAANAMAETVTSLGWRAGMALCLTGGVAGVYRPYLPEIMARAVQDPEATPLDGAMAFAREIAHGG